MNTNYNTLLQGTILHSNLYNYKIEKVLGQGDFGITYLAKVSLQEQLGQLDSNVYVTIKEFFMKEINGREGTSVTASSTGKGGLFYDYKQKFSREAKNLSKLKHPNIVNVMDYFEANNTCYYVMEYLSGGDLDTLIEKRRGLGEEDTIRFTKQIGSALSFMHNNKMLHLDLKPKNVMLNADGNAILIDFGLSKQYNSSGEPESSTTVGRGTPGYAPLEQANYQDGHGFPVTIDVYAIGATMYKMLTGICAPVASVILNEGFPAENFKGNCCSSQTLKCVIKAMSPLTNDRFSSVDQLLQNLYSNKKTTYEESTIIEETVIAETRIIEFPLKIDKNTNNLRIDYFEGTFPLALSLTIIVSEQNCSYDIYNYGKQLEYGTIENFDWRSFVYTFNSLDLVVGDKRGEPGVGGSSITLVLNNKNNNIIQAEQYGQDQCGTLHGNALKLLAYFENLKDFQKALISAKSKLQKQELVHNTPDTGIQKNKKIIYTGIVTLLLVSGAWILHNIFSKEEAPVEEFVDVEELIDLVTIKGNTFTMGYDSGLPWTQRHEVTLSDYCIGRTEVTQRLWKAVMNSNPSVFKGDDLPVENVKWQDVQTFLTKLNAKTGKKFRLPTEAEWEYAALGGDEQNKIPANDEESWYDQNSDSHTHVVATLASNELGLYDMNGNVSEWCSDWYGAYPSEPQYNPKGASKDGSGMGRNIIRGGNWTVGRIGQRERFDGGDNSKHHEALGFRLACDL